MRLPTEIDPNYPRGHLFGTVTCASTGAPLSSATIYLQALREDKNIWCGIQKLGVTDSNGRFSFRDIPASMYYIFATLRGYTSSASLISRACCFGIPVHLDAPKQVLDAVLVKATTSPDFASEVSLPLTIGGTISGRVFWQDGSPAIRNQLNVFFVDTDNTRRDYFSTFKGTDFCPQISNLITDEDGRFYLDGLPPAEYIIGAKAPRFLNYVRRNLLWNGVPPTINCASHYYWTGDTPNLAEAVPVKVESGSSTSDVNLTVPMLPLPTL